MFNTRDIALTKLMRKIGYGYVATISGIEATNIGLYLVMGSSYGLMGLLLIPILFLSVAYLQEVVTYMRGFDDTPYEKSVVGLAYYTMVILGSVFVLLANTITLSLVVRNILGIPATVFALFYLVAMYAFTINKRIMENLLRVFIVGSIALTVYPAAAIYLVISGGTPQLTVGNFPSFYVLVALFGALSSPYSLVLQEESNTLFDLGVGYVYGVILGVSIGLIGIYRGASDPFILAANGGLLEIMVVIGLFSTVSLAIASIYKSITLSAERLGRGTVWGSRYVMYLLVISILFMISGLRLNLYSGLLDVITEYSFLIGMCMVVSTAIMTYRFVVLREIPKTSRILNAVALTSTILMIAFSIMTEIL